MGVSSVNLWCHGCYDNRFFSPGFRDAVQLPVAGVGIGQYRAVGIDSSFRAAQIVIGEGNGVAVL